MGESVLVIRVLVLTLFCIFCTVFLYCLLYVYLFLFVLFVLLSGLLPPAENSIAVKITITITIIIIINRNTVCENITAPPVSFCSLP